MVTRRAGVLTALAVTGALLAGASGPVPARAAEVPSFSFGGVRLGVQLEEVGADEVAALGLSAPGGARVVDVTDGSPAAEAGVREGDVIVAYGGESVRGVAQLTRLVRETPAGREVSLELIRDGQRRTLRVAPEEARLGELLGEHSPLQGLRLPERFAFDFEPFESGPGHFAWWQGGDRPRLGIQYQEISGQLAGYFGVARERGVLVIHVDEGGAAARAGVEAGDVLLELAGRRIEDGGDLRRALGDVEAGETAPLTVLRRGQQRALEVRPEEGRPPRPRVPGEAL
jgi:serine protease Do